MPEPTQPQTVLSAQRRGALEDVQSVPLVRNTDQPRNRRMPVFLKPTHKRRSAVSGVPGPPTGRHLNGGTHAHC